MNEDSEEPVELNERRLKSIKWEVGQAEDHLQQAVDIAEELEMYGKTGTIGEIQRALNEVEQLAESYKDM